MKKFLVAAVGCGLAISGALAADNAATAPATSPATTEKPADAKPTGPAVALNLGPIHNGFRMGRKIISGSCPYGDAGFAALAVQGVKTIVDVDGAKPDADLAAKYGMRTVHIPVPYSGITRDEQLEIIRAVRDLDGPVFVHCHHGEHRGPTAAVLAAMALEGWTNEDGLEALGQAGTSKGYAGLWQDVREFKKPTAAEIDAADNKFPSSAPIPAIAESMVSIDGYFDSLKAVKAAGWKAPAAHPDVDPAHQALLLKEQFREIKRTPQVQAFPTDFMKHLDDAETAATALEAALRGEDVAAKETAFKVMGENCGSCHKLYRN